MTYPKHDYEETCLCGTKFTVLTHMIDLERKLCEDCYHREAYIVLLQSKMKMLKHERPYSVSGLTRLHEFHEMRQKMSF